MSSIDKIVPHVASDPRTADWPLVDSYVPIALISASYLYFVLKCGPKFMEKREAYSLLTFTKYYNVFQILANGLFVYRAYQIGWFRDYGVVCKFSGYGTDLQSMQIASMTWWLLLLKLADYAETAVFVLRKKQKQITFLHLYHHVSTALLCWWIVKRYAIGPTIFLLVVNCIVHVIMYTYYFLSTLGPNVQRAIAPFKQTVTIIQMVQFVILFLYSLQGYFPSCDVNKSVTTVVQIDIVLNMYLFYSFYRKTYMKPKRK